MQFLKTLFWVVVAVALVLFATANWKTVDIAVWGGLIVAVNLPLLVVTCFLVGFLPLFVTHRLRLAALRRRLETQAGPASNTPPPIRNAPPPPDTTPRSNL